MLRQICILFTYVLDLGSLLSMFFLENFYVRVLIRKYIKNLIVKKLCLSCVKGHLVLA